MMYRIEFLRYIDGRSDPEITQRISGEFPTLQAAIDRGAMLFGAMQGTIDAQGFRVLENGERVVAHRFKSQP
jgi:hypothetical protein